MFHKLAGTFFHTMASRGFHTTALRHYEGGRIHTTQVIPPTVSFFPNCIMYLKRSGNKEF